MSLNDEEIKQAEQERLAFARKERAEAFLAQQKADALRGWYFFLRKHSGQQAVNGGMVYVPNEANNLLMEETVKIANEQINESNLEKAFKQLTAQGRLTKFAPSKYVPKTLDSSIMPQQRNEAAAWKAAEPMPANLIGVTKHDILGWSKERLRWESRTPERLKALNAILANQA